ncbi:hypothetical protein [Bacillus sp. V5-8f]|uniref:hypothetical protein n=1 Tax=Bacillus sp. V5-8f TaxID=2053044 RepID=UPI000C75DAF6|nr:hypothetical protein [Bacillus sp. V5-8f]PLT32737.1 hypothetical protein CUU64_17685 [Bacillus sp. V5-8f]
MDKGIHFIFGAFAGWLLVQVASTLEGAFGFFTANSWVPTMVSAALTFVGVIITLIFSFPVIKTAWRHLRSE